jgi:hypothetical protein
MPTKRTRISHHIAEGISPIALYCLSDELFPLSDGLADEDVSRWRFSTGEAEERKLWEQCKGVILATWINQYPGTRPSCWWRYDAPEKCRKRLGGIGTPGHEVLAYAEELDHGLPGFWLDQWICKYYGPDFKGVAIDPKNPPCYESQAAYLKRHGLLTPAEQAQLRPKDFKPELVLGDDDGD